MIDKSIAKALTAQQQAKAAEAQAEPQPAAEAFTPPAAPVAQRDAYVDSALNDADIEFRKRDEASGCQSVQFAIRAAALNPVSDDQARQLREYAQRCGLRY